MQIQVRTPAGVLVTLDVKPWDTVIALRCHLATLVGIAAERQRLNLGSRQLEDGRILLEYGIREQRAGDITIELSELEVPWTSATIGDAISGTQEFPHVVSTSHLRGLPFPELDAKCFSPVSTCVPSECASDAGDLEMSGASIVASTAELTPLPASAYASLVSQDKEEDAFVVANKAHISYLLMRRRRLEAEGYGLSALCR